MENIPTPQGGRLELYPTNSSRQDTVLICPGGGYSFLSPREAEPIARAFQKAGYHAAVLYYDLSSDVLGTFPLEEVAWSVRYLRTDSHWAGKGKRVFVAGFSAGGHLAASLGVLWNYEPLFTHKPTFLCTLIIYFFIISWYILFVHIILDNNSSFQKNTILIN